MSTRAEQFVEVYRRARVEDQVKYYEPRAKAHDAAHRQLLLASAVAFGVSAAVGLIAGLDVPGKLAWAILAAIVPAITTALSAYEGVYAFERVAKLFGDAARNLRRVEAPPLSGGADDQDAIAGYVAEVEAIVLSERGQWGQLEPPAAQ